MKEERKNYSGLPNMREEFLLASQFLILGGIAGIIFMIYMLSTL